MYGRQWRHLHDEILLVMLCLIVSFRSSIIAEYTCLLKIHTMLKSHPGNQHGIIFSGAHHCNLSNVSTHDEGLLAHIRLYCVLSGEYEFIKPAKFHWYPCP